MREAMILCSWKYEAIPGSWLNVTFISPLMTSWNGNIPRVTGPLWGYSEVIGEFPSRKPVNRNIDVLYDLRLKKQLSQNRDATDRFMLHAISQV